MAATLTYGFVKPATGDKGSVFWPALEGNIQQTNDHAHNGTDSHLLSASASRAIVQTVSSASWGSDLGGGTYRQLVTLPVSITGGSGTFDDFSIQLRDSSTGEVIYGRIVKVSSTTYYIYVNDNTLTLKAIYS